MTVRVAGDSATPLRTAQAAAPSARSSTAGLTEPMDPKSARVTVRSEAISPAHTSGAAVVATSIATERQTTVNRGGTDRSIAYRNSVAGDCK
jgi:hypothetical protein